MEDSPNEPRPAGFRPFKQLAQVLECKKRDVHEPKASKTFFGHLSACGIWSDSVTSCVLKVATAIVRTAGSAIALVEDAELRK